MRHAARVVLLDAQDRILLLLHARPRGGVFWATPGGGVEPGETEAQAAARELWEELGLRDVALQPGWTGRDTVELAGAIVEQTEHYFFGRHEPWELELGEVQRREGILRARWWTLEEVSGAEEEIYPVDLAARVRSRC